MGYSVVNYLLGYRENPESIDERSIDEVFFKGLGKQSKIDVPLDRDRRTLGFPRDPFSWDSISQNSLEGTKIKNRSTLNALESNKNDDEKPLQDISL